MNVVPNLDAIFLDQKIDFKLSFGILKSKTYLDNRIPVYIPNCTGFLDIINKIWDFDRTHDVRQWKNCQQC